MTSSDDDRRPVSERVVAAVCSELEADPTEVEPLYDAVDPEAIDALFPAAPDAADDPARQFTFTYEGYVVDVAADGTVDLSQAESGSPVTQPAGPSAATTTGSPDAPD